MSYVNHNLMAANTARTLNEHYSRLATSTERLSTGLRVSSAADDAAGLAIRELQRAEISALHQGARNANDAVSLIQVADGALSVIDEKLIRMKELAEQAATGTYDSTQRLMLESEYQAMAREIDRIANSTDFNGIKLLDGSRAGRHDGSGLESAGALKIHFGSGNDSAEDYYYVEIGDCRTPALGVGNLSEEPYITYDKKESLTEKQHTFTPKDYYFEYTDPATGTRYYSDGDYFFTDWKDPVNTALDWEKDATLIAGLSSVPATVKNTLSYTIYTDPRTGTVYYMSGSICTTDPFDPNGKNSLDPKKDSEIINRLITDGQRRDIETTWSIYANPDGVPYYSLDGGTTFVPDINDPTSGMLNWNILSDRAPISLLEPQPTATPVPRPEITYSYEMYYDPDNHNKIYYRCTFMNGHANNYWVSDPAKPESSRLDSVEDADLIARLKQNPLPDSTSPGPYDTYLDPNGTPYYTLDNGNTFFTDWTDPAHTVSKPANLEAKPDMVSEKTSFLIYEDKANPNDKYITMDNGKTYVSVTDHKTPRPAGVLLQPTTAYDSTTVEYQRFRDPATHEVWLSPDKGATFLKLVGENNTPKYLDPQGDAAQIATLKPIPYDTDGPTYYRYEDKNGDIWYHDGTRTHPETGRFVKDMYNPNGNNPLTWLADQAAIEVLVAIPETDSETIKLAYPDQYMVYVDPETNLKYYSPDGGRTFTRYPVEPTVWLDGESPADKKILARLEPLVTAAREVEYIPVWWNGGYTISTQAAAQRALEAIDSAIVTKDKIRAHLGAIQNRLENTITNLNIQAENLQASESRISDVDVATEMTNFVRNQILTQSATAMLGQANSMPQMITSLLGG